MIAWITNHQDFLLFSLMAAILCIGYYIGASIKRDEMQYLITDYENLLNLAYADKQNLVVALASIQGRQEGQYLGYRANVEPRIFDPACTCEFCQGMRNN